MRRWVILILGLPVYAFVLMVLASVIMGALAVDDWTSADWGEQRRELLDVLNDSEWWTFFGIGAMLVVGSQAIFLIPVLGKRPPKGERSRSLTISLIIGGAVAAALTTGFAMALVEFATTVLESGFDLDDTMTEVSLAVLLVGSWTVWSGVLLIFCRGIWADRVLGRLVGLLLASTVLEALVVLPLDIMVRRRTDCYCFTGTLFALCIASVATLWLAGPGIIIALTSKKHRRWRELHCFRCGYAKGPSPGAVCPECGFEWSGN